MHSIEQIRQWCAGEWLAGRPNGATIEELAIDSRAIEHADKALFVALGSGARNGHQFLIDAYGRGVRAMLVSEQVDITQFLGASIILVPDTLTALQAIATAHRAQYQIPVIGITGSNGKTIVKEWLYQILGAKYNVVRSPKSYNSQLGVPLSVWQMGREHQLGIFEAGISLPHEMDKLEKVIRPTIGVFTNIGEAHNEGFQSLKQKINQKLYLFIRADVLVYCIDQEQVHECVNHFRQHVRGRSVEPLKLFTWSRHNDADLHVLRINKLPLKTEIFGQYQGQEVMVSIPFTDDASIENAIQCWCVGMVMQLSQEEIQRGMTTLQTVSMRLELRHGINDCTVINDAYNSDLTSLQTALGYMGQQKQHQKHTVILSDMLQMGKREHEMYEEVVELIGKRNIQRFIGIGPVLYKFRTEFRKHKKLRSLFFKSTNDFISHFYELTFNNEAILLKGARVFEFEKIALLLEQQVHQTVMTIDLGALKQNLNVFRSVLKPGVKTMAMVKAFAYGSGSYEIAALLQHAGIDYLTVAYTDEGISLRRAGISLPIMVMSPDVSSFDRMIAWRLEPEIFNFRSLAMFTHVAETLRTLQYPIHIKLDTGMHRLGFNPEDMAQLAALVKDNECLRVASIFSHLAASDDPNEDDFSMLQGHRFEEMSQELINALKYTPLRHLCNSSGIARLPNLHYDMVRLGLGLYGFDSSEFLQYKLHQISTLRTKIAQIRVVEEGETIGYGHKARVVHRIVIATICIGYADGYPRSLGHGNSYVLIHGKPANTIGSICMDMCMVDVSNIPEAREGDEAVVFSPDLPVIKLAEWAGTISYEIMTGISQRVKRVYSDE